MSTNMLTLWDRAQMFWALLPAPVVLTWALLKSPFTPYGRSKSWKRIIHDRLMLLITRGMTSRQILGTFGATRPTYDNFMREARLTPLVEDIGDNAKLLWIGPKRTDNVLLYFHGGAFLLGMQLSSPKFWRYIQEKLEIREKEVGVAILNYTLVPDGAFPTQLKQAVLAIGHLLKMGVRPRNLQIAGDSAGGALIHQTLSHLLHPVTGVPELELSAPLSGVYMMSPCTRLVDKDGCLYTNDYKGDILTGKTLHQWGTEVLRNTPQEARPYLEANSAPPTWLGGVDRYVKRVLISAGGVECLRDEIIAYQNTFKEQHRNVTFILHENGTHNDPFGDFLTKEKDLGTLTPHILDWLDEGFSKKY